MALPTGFSAETTSGSGHGDPAFYAEMLAIADELINQYGMVASLRLNSGATIRECFIVISDYMPKDAETQLANPTLRTVLIAAGLGDIPNAAPDWQNEMLVTYVQPVATPPVINEILAFTEPLKLYSPAGIVVLYQTNVKR